MDLYLVRHGNTFAPGDKVVRAGSSTDYPLVDRGREQADEMAAYLKRENVSPVTIYAGPLQRTTEFANILRVKLQLENSVITDSRLNELDYGVWSGLTDEEIAIRYNEEELEAWNSHSIWPESSIFGGSEEESRQQALSFLDNLHASHGIDDSVVAVSSNGKLRYFLAAIDGEFEKRRAEGTLKVKTGHICKLQYLNGRWAVLAWNVSPSV